MDGVFPTFRVGLVMVLVMAAAGATCTIVQQAPWMRTPTAAVITPDGGSVSLAPPLTAFCGTASLRAEVQDALKDARKNLENARDRMDVALLIQAQAQVERAMWLVGNCQ